MPHANVLVTVIVPVYRAEGTIARCIDSILAQTHDTLQLVLVDDGSPDSSGVICDAYASSDARVLVKHTVNQGVSAARNEGICLARGEYIAFVDSDDWIDAAFIADGLAKISRHGADLFLSGLNEETYRDGAIISAFPSKGPDKMYDIKELINVFNVDYPFFLICGVWCKLYKTDIIRRHNVLFDTNYTFGEDMLFNCDYLEHADNVVFSSGVFYHYFRGNPDSLFSRYYPDMYEMNIPLYERMLSMMRGRGCGGEAIRRMEGIYVRVLVGCIYHEFAFCGKSTPSSRKEVIRKVARNSYVRRYPVSNDRHIKDIALLVLLKLGAVGLINRLFTGHYCKETA